MNYSRTITTNVLVGVLASATIPGLAQASGFAVTTQNASGLGNAYAGAAAHAMDASTVFWNPAGMMQLERDMMSISGHYLKPTSEFKNDGSTSAESLGSTPLQGENNDGGFDSFVPNFYWVTSVDPNTKFGLAFTVPFGSATKYDDTWVGRYHGVSSELRTFLINPSLAYRINDKLTVGAGIDMIIGEIEFTSAVDFGAICAAQGLSSASCSPQDTDGFTVLDGDNYSKPGFGFNIGLQYNIQPETVLGVSYRSEVDLDFEGKADFSVPSGAAFVTAAGLFNDGDISSSVTAPASLLFSFAHQVDKVTYLADITWTGWSTFQELRILYDNAAQPDSVTTEEWNDTFRYSVGLDYQYSKDLVLRTGVALDETAIPNKTRRTARLSGNDRTWVAFGGTYFWDENLTIDFGYTHLFLDDAKIENTFESSVPTLAATLEGEFEASVDILSVQLNWNF